MNIYIYEYCQGFVNSAFYATKLQTLGLFRSSGHRAPGRRSSGDGPAQVPQGSCAGGLRVNAFQVIAHPPEMAHRLI
jgi:hypothetical protein